MFSIILCSSLRTALADLINPETRVLPMTFISDCIHKDDMIIQQRFFDILDFAKCLPELARYRLLENVQQEIKELIECEDVNKLCEALVNLMKNLIPIYYDYKRCKLADRIKKLSEFRDKIKQFRKEIDPGIDCISIIDIKREYFYPLMKLEQILISAEVSKNFIAQSRIGFSIFQLLGLIKPAYIPRDEKYDPHKFLPSTIGDYALECRIIKNASQILYRLPENGKEIVDLMLILGNDVNTPYVPIPIDALDLVLSYFGMTESDLDEVSTSVKDNESLSSYDIVAKQLPKLEFDYNAEVAKINLKLRKKIINSYEQGEGVTKKMLLEYQKSLEELEANDKETKRTHVSINLIQVLAKLFGRCQLRDQIGFAFDNLYLGFAGIVFLLRASVLGNAEELAFEDFMQNKNELFEELMIGLNQKLQEYREQNCIYFSFYMHSLKIIIHEFQSLQTLLNLDFDRKDWDYLMVGLDVKNMGMLFTADLLHINVNDFYIQESELIDSSKDLLRYDDRLNLHKAIQELCEHLNRVNELVQP